MAFYHYGIAILYFISNKIQIIKNDKIKEFIKNIMIITYIVIGGILLSFSIQNIYNYIYSSSEQSNLKHYKHIIADDKKIRKIDNYILEKEKTGKNVYILDAQAAYYMIPLDKYNKDFDMLMKGNFGAKGEEGLIETIKESKDSLYLVLNSKFRNNWQHPHEVTNYIKQNLKHIGSIENYEIYLK